MLTLTQFIASHACRIQKNPAEHNIDIDRLQNDVTFFVDYVRYAWRERAQTGTVSLFFFFFLLVFFS